MAEVLRISEDEVEIEGIGTLAVDVTSVLEIRVHVYSGNDTVGIDAAVDVSAFVYGREGDDTISGGSGADLLDGGTGDDELHGGDGGDSLYGRLGNDLLFGGWGNDQLHGDDNDDFVRGGDGDDLVAGGTGLDSVSGEIGVDEYLVDVTENYLDDDVFDLDEVVVFTDASHNSNYAPQLEPPGVKQVDAGSLLSFQLNASDADVGQSLTFSATSALPPGATLSPSGVFSWTPTNEQSDQDFEVQITVVDNGTPQQHDIELVSISVNRALPDVPRELEVSDATSTGATIAWEPSALADSYQVERRLATSGTWTNVGMSASASFADSMASAGVEYEYRVQAVNAAGSSPYSSPISATTTLPTPTGLTATILNPDSMSGAVDVELEWSYELSASGDKPISFTIERATRGNDWVEIASPSISARSSTRHNQANGSVYFYRLAAHTEDATSHYSNVAIVTTAPVNYHEKIGQWYVTRIVTATEIPAGSPQPLWWHNVDNAAVTLDQAFLHDSSASIVDSGIGYFENLEDPNDPGPGDIPKFNLELGSGVLNRPGPELVFFNLEWSVDEYLVTFPGGPSSTQSSVTLDTWSVVEAFSGYFGAYASSFGDPSTGQIVAETINVQDLNSAIGPERVDELHFEGSFSADPMGIGWIRNLVGYRVDLSIGGMLDLQEETDGTLIAVNNNFDEGNSAGGLPRPDNEPTSAIVAGDPNLLQVDLSFTSNTEIPGKWRLEFADLQDAIRVWRPDGSGYAEVLHGEEIPITIDDASQAIPLLIEGIETYTTSGTQLRAVFVPDETAADGQSTNDFITLRIAETVDLASDSNNDGLIDDADEAVEDTAGLDAAPGQVIVVNDADVDQDGIADYLDGFDWFAHPDSELTEGVVFAPLELTIPESFIDPVIELRYSASSPSGIRSTVEQPVILPQGHLRLWTLDGDQARDATDLLEDGDFVAPGQYTPAELNLTDGTTTTLYVEAIRESAAVADQTVTLIVTDGETGFQVEDQVRFTAVRYEIEGRNLDGNWEPKSHFVASTLTSGAPENLNQAWNTYRVNIYDPRQTGLSSIQIEATSLPLANIGDKYQTPEFHAITEQSATPQGVPFVEMSGEAVEMDYNPPRRSKYTSFPDLSEWDQELADLVTATVNQIETEVTNEQLDPGNSDGWFGNEVHQRVSDDLDGPRWRTNVYVHNETLEIMKIGNEPGGSLKNTTQIDVLHLEDEYNPQRGQILDVTKVEDIYEIKTSLSGRVNADQERRLKAILNALDPDGTRQIKPAVPHKLFVRHTNTFIPNPKYGNGIRLLGMIGVAAGTAQTAHAMWTFSSDDPEFRKLITEAKIIRRQAGSPNEKAAQWIDGPLLSFLTDRFGPEYAILATRALYANEHLDTVWNTMKELE